MGASRGVLKASWGLLGASSGGMLDFLFRVPPLGAVLGFSWAVVGASWAVLRTSEAVLGASWAVLGASWAVLEPLGQSLGRQEHLKKPPKDDKIIPSTLKQSCGIFGGHVFPQSP